MKTAIQETSGNRIVYDLAASEYHRADMGISRSGLLKLDQSPRHYWWEYLSGQADREESDCLRIGSAFHSLVLEPQKFADHYAVWSGAPRNTKAGKEEYDLAVKASAGKQLIKQAELSDMKRMAEAVLSEPASKKVINAYGNIEASFFWYDEAYGVDVKTRPDYYRDDGIVLDLKTCEDASEDAFQKSIVSYGYDLQAFMTMEGIGQVTGKRPTDFIFVCVEKSAPHCVAFYSATPELIACGEARYHRLMAIYAACKKKNHWPGYGHFVRPIGPPEWYVKKLTKEGPTQ